MAVDFKDYIVLIEAPQSEERALAIIAEAKRLIPNKPIVCCQYAPPLRSLGRSQDAGSRGHDHHPRGPQAFLRADAQRAAFAQPGQARQGETSVVDRNHDIEKSADRREPRHRAASPAGNQHNEGLIFAYLPKQRILIEADAYNAGPANAPTPDPISRYNVNLIQTVDRLGLAVDRVIPIHYPADRRVVTKAEVLRSIGR